MTAVEVMDGEVVRRWFRMAADALGATRSAIDAINVFPVPDADTGTNMHATIVCAADAVAEMPPGASQAEIWHAAATGALRGACGNSGIIVSQLLRGLADTCGPAAPCDGRVVAIALGRAAVEARAAVRRPVEGTILTVADKAAEAAAGASSLTDVGHAAALGAREALGRTEQQLQVLAANGVVDAGAAGLCVVLDALDAAISGTQPWAYELPLPGGGHRGTPAQAAASALAMGCADTRASPHAYEVTFLLDAAEQAVDELRDRLDRLGDSLVVSGSDRQWHVHVHVADAGAVIESGLMAGRPSKITVTYLNAPRANRPAGEPAAADLDGAWRQASDAAWAPRAGRVIVASQGAGLARLLRQADAIVIEAEPGVAPAVVLAQVARLPGPNILIIDNESLGVTGHRHANSDDGELGTEASAAQPEKGPASHEAVSRFWPAGWPLIEIGCAIQAIAALAVHDPQRDMQADVAAMIRAVAGMRYASVCPQAGGSLPAAGLEFVGRVADQVVARGTDQAAVARAVLGPLLAQGTELLTLLTGQAADPDLGALAAAHAAVLAPAAEVVCYDGGMTSAVLLIGAE